MWMKKCDRIGHTRSYKYERMIKMMDEMFAKLKYLDALKSMDAITTEDMKEKKNRIKALCNSIEKDLKIQPEDQNRAVPHNNHSLVFHAPEKEDGKLLLLLNSEGLSSKEFAELRDAVDRFLKVTKYSKTKVRTRRDLISWNLNELDGIGRAAIVMDEMNDCFESPPGAK